METPLPSLRRAAAIALAAVALAAYAAFLIRHASFVVGASDSSGYLNLARLLAGGEVVQSIPELDAFGLPADDAPLFTPLGFVKGPRPGTRAPYYAPGFPAHMALLAWLLGWATGPFLVAPLAAAAIAALVHALARELGASPGEAVAGALLVAIHPVTIYFALQPMSDVVALAWSTATIYAAVRSRRAERWAYLAGAGYAIACAIRPANALLALPLALALPWRRGSYLRAVLGAAPFVALLFRHNFVAYGHPLVTGYGDLKGELALGFFDKRFGHYTHWLGKTFTPLVPFAWLALPIRRRLPGRDRALLLVWFASFFFFYCFYRHYEQWWNLRFLLPGFPALVLGAVFAARPIWEWLEIRLAVTRTGARTGNLLPVLVLAFALNREVGVLDAEQAIHVGEWERVYPEACQGAAALLPERSIVLSMLMSGALESYTALPILRYDLLEEGDWARVHAGATRAGYRFYALVHPAEMDQFRRQAPARWTPIATFREAELVAIDSP